MPLQLPDVSDTDVVALVEEIDRTGFGTLKNYIGDAELTAMRAFVGAAVEKSPGEYVGFSGRQAVEGTVLDEMSQSASFCDLMRRVYERGTGKPAPEIDFYQVLRCLTGRSGEKHSLRFHFDSYVVTALIPVEIPTASRDGEKTGDLIMIPNCRRVRKSYAANVFDKILLDNPLTQFALKHLSARGIVRLTRIKLVPGNIYFFWGYRSIHTNEACAQHKVRATALFHFANPHAASKLSTSVHRPLAGKRAFG